MSADSEKEGCRVVCGPGPAAVLQLEGNEPHRATRCGGRRGVLEPVTARDEIGVRITASDVAPCRSRWGTWRDVRRLSGPGESCTGRREGAETRARRRAAVRASVGGAGVEYSKHGWAEIDCCAAHGAKHGTLFTRVIAGRCTLLGVVTARTSELQVPARTCTGTWQLDSVTVNQGPAGPGPGPCRIGTAGGQAAAQVFNLNYGSPQENSGRACSLSSIISCICLQVIILSMACRDYYRSNYFILYMILARMIAIKKMIFISVHKNLCISSIFYSGLIILVHCRLFKSKLFRIFSLDNHQPEFPKCNFDDNNIYIQWVDSNGMYAELKKRNIVRCFVKVCFHKKQFRGQIKSFEQ